MEVSANVETSALKLYVAAKSAGSLRHLMQLWTSVNWAEVRGPADTFFNLGTRYSQYDFDEEAIEIWKAGLAQYPNDIDLLCALFQASYGTFGNLAEAQTYWEKLKELHAESGPVRNWRFYSYGATYLTLSNAPSHEALDHLKAGFPAVNSESVASLYVTLSKIEKLAVYSDEYSQELDELFAEGLAKRVTNAHLIALILCQRAQRRAASRSPTEQASSTALQEALNYCELAKTLYIDVERRGNHPIEEVWFHEARLLVMLGRYNEALPVLRAIEASDERATRVGRHWFSTVAPLKAYCEHLTGQAAQAEANAGDVSAALEDASEAEILEAFRRSSSFGRRVMKVLSRLRDESE